MQLAQILFTQGFGTRRECAGLIAAGLVRIAGRACTDPGETSNRRPVISVRGVEWPLSSARAGPDEQARRLRVFAKAAPPPERLQPAARPLRLRDVQAVGRLDEDTTGLLLFTDDGALIHRLTSPKHHVPKVYEVSLQTPGRCGAVARSCAPA